uniref:Uncharacterized protein n=1 Tax=Glossina brevipalpis TaxID=37001 RepID=A0A1A9WGR1_9MUSC
MTAAKNAKQLGTVRTAFDVAAAADVISPRRNVSDTIAFIALTCTCDGRHGYTIISVVDKYFRTAYTKKPCEHNRIINTILKYNLSVYDDVMVAATVVVIAVVDFVA